MTDHLSDQETLTQATPRKPLAPEDNGVLRRVYFSFTTPAGGVAVNDTIALCRLPLGARVYPGRFIAEAMTSAGGTAKVQIGTLADPDRYLGSTSVDSAADLAFANTVALGLGEKLTEETVIYALNPDDTSEAWAAGQDVVGYIDYVMS